MQNRNDQQDPYDRPQSTDPRRERDRNNDRDRRSGRNRKSSPSPAGLRGIMKKNFEMSDTGITSGALGTFHHLQVVISCYRSNVNALPQPSSPSSTSLPPLLSPNLYPTHH